MKEVFKYTFLTVAEIKKLLFVVVIVSIFSLLQAFPVISIVSFIFEKILYLSIGFLLIYILKNTSNEDEFFNTLKKQPISTFFLHFLPNAMGIMLGSIILVTFFSGFFIILLKFTNSLFILANPHNFLFALANTTYIAKILLGFFSVYMLFFSYIFLGKFGEALTQDSFKKSFLSIISSVIDFKFWINTFNLKYMIIFSIWSILVFVVYSIVSFSYIFYIFPLIINNPNFSLIIIPLLVAITTIITYFTFFSAYFSYKTLQN